MIRAPSLVDFAGWPYGFGPMGHAPVLGRNLDGLQSMTVFVQVVEARSFTAAARALDTTTSAVSKRVARLEERLGVRLLERTTRALAPTEAGLAFYERCAHILHDVEDAELAVTQLGSTPRGTLRVSALGDLGDSHLGSLLPELLAQYEDLRVEVDLADGPVNLVEEGYDIAIRAFPAGAVPDSSLIVRRIGTAHAVLCGAPSYFERRGVPQTLDDLADHDCLHYTAIPLALEWTFQTVEGPRTIPVRSRVHMNSSSGLRMAAVGGAGLFRTAHHVVGDALRTGALRSVLDEHSPLDLGLYVMYPAGKQLLPKVKVCVDFLVRELGPRLAGDGWSRASPAQLEQSPHAVGH
jgi:DNA-binding transcriptional LysR family regulator